METPAAQEVDAVQSGLSDVLRRHADERAALKKRHDKTRSGIPKKDRIGRQRFLEDARHEEAKLTSAHNAELKDLGYNEAQISTALSALTLSNNNTDDQSASRDDSRNGRPTAVAGLQQPQPQQQNGTTTTVTIPSGRTESKAARRRRRKAEQEAASQQRIAQEKMAMGPSEKAVELNAINIQLAPKHMRIHPIAADGHCLYSAIAHQMTLAGMKLLPAVGHNGGATAEEEVEEGEEEEVLPSVDALRAVTADFLLSHRDEYMPFIESVEGDESRYVEYCNDVRSTATWGGHIELQALSKVLHTVIEVYAADMPVLRIGDDEKGGTDDERRRRSTSSSQSKQVLRVSFHRKFIHLGDHYNSVVPSNVK